MLKRKAWYGIIALQCAAFWPLWGWYVRRALDPCDTPWHLLPLGTLVVYLWQQRDRTPCDLRWALWRTLPVMFLYAALYHILPPLVSAGIAVTAIALVVSPCFLRSALHPGAWGLLILSLPVMLTFEFYAGFPLRALVTRMTAALLSFSGHVVTAQGAALEAGGRLVSVDAPCSGIKMLWVGAYLTLTLACFYRLTAVRTVMAGCAAFLLALFGNVVRAASLFYLELGLLEGRAGLHTAIGMVAFGLTAGLTVWIVVLLAKQLTGRVTCELACFS